MAAGAGLVLGPGVHPVALLGAQRVHFEHLDEVTWRPLALVGQVVAATRVDGAAVTHDALLVGRQRHVGGALTLLRLVQVAVKGQDPRVFSPRVVHP